MQNKWNIDLEREHTTQCPRCARNGRDRSRNNLKVYGGDSGAYCWSCQFTIPSAEHRASMGWDEDECEEEEVSTKEKITLGEVEKLKTYTGEGGKGARGITDVTYRHYAVRTKYDETTGEPDTQYYPYFEDGVISGFKVRKLPKTFSTIGKVSAESELFGYFRYKNSNSKIVCLTAGEIDCMTLRDALVSYNKARGSDWEETPVVSMGLGETGSAKQLKAHYDWFDKAEKIIYFPDQDEVGQEAIKNIVKVLPQGKVWIAKFNSKDLNELRVKGRDKEIVSAFFSAQKYVPNGITASTNIQDKMKEFLSIPRLTLPPYLHKLQKMLRGGLPVCIFNVLSSSGSGKSTHIDAMTLHWIMNSGKMVGIIPMETSEGETGVNLLSSYSEFKMNLLETEEERLAFIQSEDSLRLQQELFYKEDGSPRFYILDAEAHSLQARVEYLIVSLGCTIIICDPLQDVMDMLGDDEQAKFMAWQKSWMKKGITFVNVNHSRKSGQGQKANSKGADLSEEDMMGSSTIFKSGGVNLVLMRNKEAEDPIERNTTIMKLTKARGVGETGIVGKYYYEMEKHKLWDLDDWNSQNTHQF